MFGPMMDRNFKWEQGRTKTFGKPDIEQTKS